MYKAHTLSCTNVSYLFRTLRYSLVYMPLPGPPAENEPPPPIIMFRTQKAIKSGSLWAQLSSPNTTWASSGIGVGPRLTLDKSFSTCRVFIYFFF